MAVRGAAESLGRAPLPRRSSYAFAAKIPAKFDRTL